MIRNFLLSVLFLLVAAITSGCATMKVTVAEPFPVLKLITIAEPLSLPQLEMLPKQPLTAIVGVSLPPEQRFVMPTMYFVLGLPPVHRHTPKPATPTSPEVLDSFLRGTVIGEGQATPPSVKGPIWYRTVLPPAEEVGPSEELFAAVYAQRARVAEALFEGRRTEALLEEKLSVTYRAIAIGIVLIALSTTVLTILVWVRRRAYKRRVRERIEYYKSRSRAFAKELGKALLIRPKRQKPERDVSTLADSPPEFDRRSA